MGIVKNQIRDKLGHAKFEEVYRFLVYHRSQASEDSMIYEELKHRVQGNRYLMTEIFKLDGIVFRELLQK